MSFKNTLFLSFFVSIFFSSTYSMDSGSIKNNLINAIGSLKINKLKTFVMQFKFSQQDKIKSSAANSHYNKLSRGDLFTLSIWFAPYLAVLAIIAHVTKSNKDPKIPEILSSNETEIMNAYNDYMALKEEVGPEGFQPNNHNFNNSITNHLKNAPHHKKIITDFDVCLSCIGHYSARLLHTVKNGARYTLNALFIASITYPAGVCLYEKVSE